MKRRDLLRAALLGGALLLTAPLAGEAGVSRAQELSEGEHTGGTSADDTRQSEASVRVGPFLLIEPPEGQVECIAETVAAIDFPWARLIPTLREDDQGAVLVRWDSEMQQGASGLYYARSHEIVLGTRYAGWQDGVPFVFAHEVGHLVDNETLGRDERDDLIALCHASPGRYDGQEQNGEEHPWSHNQEHSSSVWRNFRDDYLFRHNESFADLFVATFAPSIWEGHYPRFVHWTEDFRTVRELTLRREIVAYNDTDGTAHEEAIEWASVHGIIEGYDDGSFHPNGQVSRGQIATILKRYHDTLGT